MIRIALRFAYDGAGFPNGYARQPERGTVEDALVQALGSEGYVDGSWTTGSRTDKGVSALENVAACVLDRPHLNGLAPALQSRLPDGVWILGAATVGDDWNPRHHAVRTYSYLAPKRGESLDSMQRAATRFEGTHDMRGFARLEPHRDPVRTVDGCRVADAGDTWEFTVSSPGFLWNQVRRMVDAMLQVGRGSLTVRDIDEALETGTQHPRMDLAPPGGLLLRSVRYTPDLDWDPAAGTLDARRLTDAWQAARVRNRLLDGLSGSS